jgi:hypothetical protein
MLSRFTGPLAAVLLACCIFSGEADATQILQYNYSFTFTDNVGQSTVSGVLSIDKDSGVNSSGNSEWNITNATNTISGSFGAIIFTNGTYDQYSTSSNEIFNLGFTNINLSAVYVSLSFNAVFADVTIFDPLGYSSFAADLNSAIIAPDDSNVYTPYQITAGSVTAFSAVTPVPEPAAALLFAPAVAALAGIRRRIRRSF